MEIEDPKSVLGKPISDIYGRVLGRVAGFTFGYSGEISTVAVESGEEFVVFGAEKLLSGEDGLRVVPEWKLESQAVGLESDALRRRLAALDAMKLIKGISDDAYEQLRLRMEKAQAMQREASARIARRLEELKLLDDSVDSFLAMVRLQFISQEIDEETFKGTADYCMRIKTTNARERSEVEEMLKFAYVKEQGIRPVEEAMVGPPQTDETPTPGGMEAPSIEFETLEPERPPQLQVERAEEIPPKEEVPSDSPPPAFGSFRSLRNKPS